jgi:hypothetical protein
MTTFSPTDPLTHLLDGYAQLTAEIEAAETHRDNLRGMLETKLRGRYYNATNVGRRNGRYVIESLRDGAHGLNVNALKITASGKTGSQSWDIGLFNPNNLDPS